MMENIENNNQFYLQIIGKTPIMDDINDNKEYSVVFKRLGCTGVSKTPLEDGDYKYTYKFKNLDEITVISGSLVVKGKPKKGSQSQKLRNCLYEWYNQQFAGGDYKDFEQFYISRMSKYIQEIEEKLI